MTKLKVIGKNYNLIKIFSKTFDKIAFLLTPIHFSYLYKEKMEMNYVYSAFLGYLLGSIPTAFILLKKSKSLDIRKNGSGNVGALNAYEVSNSKSIGILVLVIDLLKGLVSYLFAFLLFQNKFSFVAISVFFAVFAHCYSPWIKFRGGRGLATAAGGLILFIPLSVITWMVTWFIIFNLSKKNIHIGNIVATVITPVVLIVFYNFFVHITFPEPESFSNFIIFALLVFSTILSKHIKPMIDLFSPIKQSR